VTRQPRPNPTADIAAIKRAATGRWPQILSAVAGIPAEVLDGKHRPCPKCGRTGRNMKCLKQPKEAANGKTISR